MEMRSYIGVEHTRSGAMIFLRGMADAQRVQSTPAKTAKSKSSSKKRLSRNDDCLIVQSLSDACQEPPVLPPDQGAR